MPRVEGLDKGQVAPDLRQVFERQEHTYGAVLYNHTVLARRPGIFRGFRAMWDGLSEDPLLPARLADLVNVRVASLVGCGL
jgi:hypothetical protein